MCDRIKGELEYGILGQGDTRVTSDLMKLNVPTSEFIDGMEDFDKEDKEDLKQIFKEADEIVQIYDKVRAHIDLQENIRRAHNLALQKNLTPAEISQQRAMSLQQSGLIP